jgi:tetratricopeptide (TPR) repeat protein
MVLPVAALEQVAAPEGRPVAGLLAQAKSEIPPEILALEMKARNHNERSERQQALALMQQVMAWVNANLPRNDPYRAQTQSIVGALLNAEGRHQEALGPTEEAIKIYSELAKTNPSLLGDLAMALNNLGMSYSLLGRRQEALAPTEEAVKVYRDLVKTNPADLNNMAKTLSNLGMCYGLLDRHQEALAPTEEAVKIYRDLAKTNPVDLAMALNNLGLTQQELGKPKQARRSVAEAVAIIRQLAATNPAFQEFMQGMLKNLEIMN